jgi:DNA-binding response OmpR family regulator
VILLTARVGEENVIQGLEHGADDYLTKPVSYRELILRIQAVVRRGAKARPRENDVASRETSKSIQFADLRLDPLSHEVYVGDASVRLTPLEFRILHVLVSSNGRPVKTEQLIGHVWGYGAADVTMLKPHISNLRRKLGIEKGAPGYVASLPRVGYYLVQL